jgi:hypothetical protein
MVGERGNQNHGNSKGYSFSTLQIDSLKWAHKLTLFDVQYRVSSYQKDHLHKGAHILDQGLYPSVSANSTLCLNCSAASQ